MKIGIVLADEGEYEPFVAYLAQTPHRPADFFGREGMEYTLQIGGESVILHCIHSLTGKVNAAAVTAHLIDEKCDMILNFGFSGGLGKVGRGGLCIADRFLEHDFDLTVLGYEKCQKPRQEYVYRADARLLDVFKKTLPEAAVGTAVCGDRFISDAAEAAYFHDTFGALTCDMESAAAAAVCDMAKVPYIALRCVSDAADENAKENYREINQKGEFFLPEMFMKCVTAVVYEYQSESSAF